jgi:hypothetical protein
MAQSGLRIRDCYPGSLFLYRILIFVHPGSRISEPGFRIQKQQQKGEGEKKLVVLPFFCSHKYHKFENYFIFELAKKKIWSNLQKTIELFT